MKNTVIKKLPTSLIIALIGIVFGIGIFGVSIVHQERLMEDHNKASVCRAQDCENHGTDPICVSSCLSAFENSMQTLPANLLNSALFILIFSIFFVVGWNFVRKNSLSNLKLFIRQSQERFILSYFSQLGNWLTLFGKRDPAIIFASM